MRCLGEDGQTKAGQETDSPHIYGRLLVGDVVAHLAARGIAFDVPEVVVQWLLARAGSDPAAGARPLRRAVQRHLEDAISDFMILHRDAGECALAARIVDGSLVVTEQEGVCP